MESKGIEASVANSTLGRFLELNRSEHAVSYIADRYKVIKSLGGNTAEVFLALDRTSGDDVEVAVKRFRTLNDNGLNEEFFIRETNALERLDHPRIVKVIDSGRDEEGIPYLVTEYVDGETLETYWSGRWDDVHSAIRICLSLLDAVGHAHAHQVIHRDLKPANILVDPDDEIKIIDFGIAKIKDVLSSELTLRDYVTVAFASPEQMSRTNVGPASDLYSIGAIAYWLLSGKVRDPEEDFKTAVLGLSVPDALRGFIAELVDPDPNLRPPSAAAALKRLRQIASELDKTTITHYIVLTNSAVGKLMQLGEIAAASESEARQVLEADLSGEVFAYFEGGNYYILGRRFSLLCAIDVNSRASFVVKGVRVPPNHILEWNKERALLVVASWRVLASRHQAPPSDEFGVLVERLEHHATEVAQKREIETAAKDLIGQWEKVLQLQREIAQDNELHANYSSYRFVEEEVVEVQLDRVQEWIIDRDQMFSMTSRANSKRQVDVGTLLDVSGSSLQLVAKRGLTETDFAQLVADEGIISVNNVEVRASLERQQRALDAIRYRESVNSRLPDVLRDPSKAYVGASKGLLTFAHKDLDDSKQKAVSQALAAKDVFLVQGPPGTGKTTFISEFVHQVLLEEPRARILVTSQSHVAVDQAISYISQTIGKEATLVRVGRRDKIGEDAHRFVLEEQLRNWVERIKERGDAYSATVRATLNTPDELVTLLTMLDDVMTNIDKAGAEQERLCKLRAALQEIEEALRDLDHFRSQVRELDSTVAAQVDVYASVQVKEVVARFQEQLTAVSEKFVRLLQEKSEKLNGVEELRTEIGFLEGNCRLHLNEAETGFGMVLEELGEESVPVSRDTAQNIRSRLLQETEGAREQLERYAKLDRIRQEWLSRLAKQDELDALFVSQVQVLAGTCLGVAPFLHRGAGEFDWVIIDEAARATPPELLVPATRGRRVLLVGDHFQLPPVFDQDISQELLDREELSRDLLETTLFESLFQKLPSTAKVRLSEQWRMHPGIGSLISETFYEGSLVSKAHPHPRPYANWWGDKAVVWSSTSGMDTRFEQLAGTSYVNTQEVRIIAGHLERLEQDLRVQGLTIKVGVIAGYLAQKQNLRSVLDPDDRARWQAIDLRVDTVDAFQGQETDVILYSMVRSNRNGSLGFLADARRLNVALSRARQLLVIVGDHELAARAVARPKNPFADVVSHIIRHPNACSIEESEHD